MPPHTHDGIDWVDRLAHLRQADAANAFAYRQVADRLIDTVPAPRPTVIDVGCGAGGMSAALATALRVKATTGHFDSSVSAGTLVLVDAVPELLAAAAETAAGCGVEVRTHRADLAGPDSLASVPPADLVWASNVVHHLPDQRSAVAALARLLAPGGWLALAEGGLSMRCLPWDLGVGEPGLQDRLVAAHGTWFHRMRTDMPDAVRLPYGWNRVLTEAGLCDITAFSYLVDVPAPLSETDRDGVVSWLTWMSHATADLLDPTDTDTLGHLLDPTDPAYVGARDDVFMLKASTVHLGRR